MLLDTRPDEEAPRGQLREIQPPAVAGEEEEEVAGGRWGGRIQLFFSLGCRRGARHGGPRAAAL